MRAGWIEAVIGAWLVAAPFVLGYRGVPYWNDVLIGLLVLVLAVVGSTLRLRLGWSNLVVGAWLVLAPVVLRYTGQPDALANDLVVGVLLIGAAIYRRQAAAHAARRRTPPSA